MSALPYVVVIAATHPQTGEVTEHTIHVDAYKLEEAHMQAMVELDAKFALIEQGYRLKLLHSGPDTAESADQLRKLLRDIGLLRSTSKGNG